MAGDTGEFPDIRQYVRGRGCEICVLPEDIRTYMQENAYVVGNNWVAWSRWLEDLGTHVNGDKVRRHFVGNHAS